MHKVVHFREVEWVGQHRNLVNLLSVALGALPTMAQTEFPIANERCELRHRDTSQAGTVKLHFATFVPGALKGVSPRVPAAAAGDLGAAQPPPNTEFTEKEMAVVVRGDAVAFVGAGAVRDKTVERAIRGLLTLHHGAEIANPLFLVARADEELVGRIMEEGVTYLDLGLTLPHANALAVAAHQPMTLADHVFGSLRNGISARLHDDYTPAQVDALAQANSRLVLNIGKSAPLELIEGLTELAAEAVASDDEFKLKTRSGAQYSRDQLLLSQHYSQAPSAYLNYQLAWDEASNFLGQVQ